jgi:hypothetical protein
VGTGAALLTGAAVGAVLVIFLSKKNKTINVKEKKLTVVCIFSCALEYCEAY